MKIVFNSYNTLSAGTSYVTRFILKSLMNKNILINAYFFIPRIDLFENMNSTGSLKIFKIPLFKSYFKYIFRIFYDIFLLPVASLILNASAVVVLANYSPMFVRGKKIVFLRHPFLVEDCDESNIDSRNYLIEKLRRIIFKLTLLSTDIVIVQTNAMKRAFLQSYGRTKARILVLPNPLSNLLDFALADAGNSGIDDKSILYVSRYAPHKQHMFLLKLAERYREEFVKRRVKFYITIDPSSPDKGVQKFLSEIQKRKLNDIIDNLGEVPNQRLSLYYRSAKCLFFPSIHETFGNPLIEAMAFALPIVVPNLDYARAICGDAGIYYQSNNIDEAYEKLIAITEDDRMHDTYSLRSKLRMNRILTVEEWLDEIIKFSKN